MIEVVKNIEKFLLGLFLIHDELKIVDNKAVEILEFAVEIFAFAVTNSIDEVGEKVGDGGVENLVIWVARKEFVADGLD